LAGKFLSLRKQAAVVTIFKKGKSTLVVNYRAILILNNYYKIFERIIHDRLSFSFKTKLHPNQHGIVKSKSTVANVNDVLPSGYSQE
jgi:hypothetical protein